MKMNENEWKWMKMKENWWTCINMYEHVWKWMKIKEMKEIERNNRK